MFKLRTGLVLAVLFSTVSLDAVTALGQQTAGDEEVTVQRVWVGDDPAFGMMRPSPDGRYLTQGWYKWDLGIIDLVTRERRIYGMKDEDLSEDPGWSYRAFYSPAGDEIAVAWREWRDDEDTGSAGISVRLLPAAGGEQRILLPADGDRWLDLRGWFPDGEHLLVETWGPRRTGYENYCLCRLRVSDGALEPIGDLTRQDVGAPLYGFSPDGRHLAFDRAGPDGSRDLYVLDVNTGEVQPVLEGQATDRLMGWLPDGSGLVFLSDRGATSGIWLLPLGSGLEPGEPRLLQTDVWGAVPLGMSRDAAFYGVTVGRPQVYTGAIDVENGGYLAAPGPVQPTSENRSGRGEFSPDGRYVAYTVARGADGYDIVVRAVGGDDVREFATSSLKNAIGWTPDSRGVLLYAQPAPGTAREAWRNRVERLDLETGEFESTNLSNTANQPYPNTQVSHDGRSMFQIEPLGDPGEWEGDPTEEEPQLGLFELGIYDDSRRLIAPVRFTGQPRLSPDGRTLAVLEVDREGLQTGSLYTVPVAGGEPTTVLEFEGDLTVMGQALGWRSGAHWTPDGRYLLFQQEGFLRKIPVAGGPVENVVELPSGEHGSPATGFRLHPDGSRFVVDAGSEKGEIWMVKNLPGTRGAATSDR
jgi:Tol biopolymer transport system component